ncbi:MAG: HRDC domain-containing protein, partial [Bdellovibrionaceae bacterium]|nr:HRDC domain-containing protein [Pseudobdellovibrionaceae bacterium]
NVIRQRWRSLDAIVSYVEGGECRHSGILTYFRDTERISNCGHCDVCAPDDDLRVPRPKPAEPVRVVRVRKSTKVQKAAAEVEAKPLTAEEETRSLALKEWRRAYAAESDIAAFIVFSNKTLLDLARRNPKTLQELERVHGFGPGRIGQIGEAVLAELRRADTR